MKEISIETQASNSLKLHQESIDPQAYQIVKTLQSRGFTTYLVGGCVRDLLLNKHPKDFDIVTSAKPQEVRQALHNAFIIGKRFRLVLVKRGQIQYEVSTFRRDAGPEDVTEEPPVGDNLFGTPEEDARRRDFTINALFYDPVGKKLIDYADGLPDLKKGIVRMIGNPNVRLLEDPIRIMRGVRLAHMIRFSLDSELRKAMQNHAQNLSNTALPRRREEFLKYLRLDNPALPFLTSLDLGVLDYIAPTLAMHMRDTAYSELFLKYLFAFHEMTVETPAELFARLIVAYYMSLHAGDLNAKTTRNLILEDPQMQKLMSAELGMFKSEQTFVAKSLQLHSLISQKKELMSRGSRRRRAIVSNESFEFTLRLLAREFALTPQDLEFWQSELAEHKRTTPAYAQTHRRPRRRPHHRRQHNNN